MQEEHKNRLKRQSNVKLILVLCGFFLVMGLIFWPSIESLFTNIESGSEQKEFYKKVEKTIVQSQEVVNPRYVSEDEKNRPYVITAKKGINDTNVDKIYLDDVVSSLRVNDESGDRITITSQKGDIISGKEGSANLQGQVALSQNQDFTIFSDKAKINFNKGLIKTNTKVEGQGTYGQFKAQGLDLDIHQGILKLYGKTSLRLEPKAFDGRSV